MTSDMTPEDRAGRAETVERRACVLYGRHTDNHPAIHSNRFPAWRELSEDARAPWRKQAEHDLAMALGE